MGDWPVDEKHRNAGQIKEDGNPTSQSLPTPGEDQSQDTQKGK